MLEALEADRGVEAVYSVGGGNVATAAAFDKISAPTRGWPFD